MGTKTFVKKSKLFTASLTIISLVTSSFSGFVLPINFAQAALSQTGPVVPVVGNVGTGFPAWYKDSNGLTLDLMESADAFGISALVEAGNAFSQQIGFGAEGFWWSAGASIDGNIAKQATLVLALEAAFAGESAIDGEQSSFGRVRYRIDALTPGETYTIKHPYGTVTEVADVDGVINVTDDIGCFAAAGVKSCDPNSPLGSPQAQFNFGAALSSQLGPFLKWTTFNPDPALTDAQLKNLDAAYVNRQYVGNPAVDHAVTGSPINQNIFRVEGPGLPGGAIETNLFSVTGRLAAAAAPVISPIANQSVQVNNPISFTVSATDLNLDPITFSVTPVSALGNEAAATINPASGVFSWTPSIVGAASFTISASDGALTANTTVNIDVIAAAPVLTTIQVLPATASVAAGTASQLTATALDAGGAQIVPAPTLTWTSSDETKATVNANGLLSAVAAGTATITATSGIVSGTAQITVTPAPQVGGGLTASIPVDPNTGFPKWYKDRNGLVLELMEAADTFGISAPVEAGNPFSQQIGFGPEGFWATADASMATTGSKPAVLVQAVEAAFAGESAVDGQQSAFGRIRIRIDINDPGTYTVTYPYGQKTYTIAAGDIGAGYEINDTNDIGCFAIPGVSSCDPNNPLGSPQPAFNFNGVGLSEVGPFISWDTFNPLNNDPALTNPANPTRKYLGNAAVAHAIKGSPTGNNVFRVEGPVGVDLDPVLAGVQNTVETNLFNVSGRLADTTAPIITVTPPNPDTVLQGAVYVDPGATAIDDFDGDVTARIQATTISTAVLGPQTITYTVADTAGNVATATRTVNVEAVVAPALTSIVVTPASASIITGAATTLNASGLDQSGAPLATQPAMTWESSNMAVATVDIATGVVTALTPGTTNITAKNGAIISNASVITVTASPVAPALTSIAVTPAAVSIAVGATANLAASALDQFGNSLASQPAVTWTSDNNLIATVDAVTGTVTAAAPGTANISATSGAVTSNNSVVTVVAAPQVLTSMNILPATMPNFFTGTTRQLVVEALDQNGAAITPTPAVTWLSVDDTVASVSPTGLVTALKPGTFTITATSVDNPLVTASTPASTVISPAAVTSIKIAPNPVSVAVGIKTQLSGIAVDGSGAPVIPAPRITQWASSNPAVATVNNKGEIKGIKVGTATITATSGGMTGTTTVTVGARSATSNLSSIVVSPKNLIVRSGKTQQFKALALDQNGIKMISQPAFTWTSNNTAVGTVNASGVFTALTAGTSVIKAANGVTNGEMLVTVNTNPGAGYVLSAIALDPENVTINLQDQQQFDTTEIDQEGVSTGESLAGIWNSSNPAVGTVDPLTGLFTALTPGTTDIAITGEGVTQTTSITVAGVAINAIEVTPANPTMTVGATQLFKADAKDSNGTKITPEPSFTWTSSDQTVGTINTSGSFTALKAGTTTVTASSEGIEGSVTVTVNAGQEPPVPTPGLSPIYRLYNKKTGAHLYARGDDDKAHVLGEFEDFEFTDGIPAFSASLTPQAGLTPMYRLFNKKTGAFLYAKGDTDKDHVLSTFTDFEFTDGIPAFYASLDLQAGLTPMYRLFNAKTGMHLYAKGDTDKDHVLSTFTDFEFTDGVPAFFAETN